ncbi:hypothetical protein VNO77_43555 [Canavalia gladiata]|uniref:Uncharacterized protein n=1 Tax=Canavalia gladiata TaxID=3824 RepID=A0AAN9JV12_CANGL
MKQRPIGPSRLKSRSNSRVSYWPKKNSGFLTHKNSDIPAFLGNSPDNKQQEFNACAASFVDCKFGSSVTCVMEHLILISTTCR